MTTTSETAPAIYEYAYYKDMAYHEALHHYRLLASKYLEKREGMTESEHKTSWLLRRYLCRNDLFYLLVFVLNRPDLMHEWLFDRCREVQAEPDGYLDLWAREHYKSTIITFGKTIQDVITDPEITVGIFSFSQDIAQQFLRQIKQEFETNQTLKALFPEILWSNPRRNARQWSDQAITVMRKGNPKEATIEAWGIIDAQPVSKHYSHRIYDDLVHERGVNTPEMIAKTTFKWELSDSLAKSVGNSGGIERYVGTIYHAHDTYSVMIARNAVKVRIHPCTSDGSTNFSNAVLLDPEVLQKKYQKQGAYTFGCQMLLDPRSDTISGFKMESLRFWDVERWDNLTRFIIVDPASRKNSTCDYTSMWVLGLGTDEKYRVIDFHRDRLDLEGRTEFLFRFHMQYKPQYVFYEQYGASADVEHMRHVMKEKLHDFSSTLVTLPCSLSEDPRTKTRFVDVVKSDKLPKTQRILRLQPYFNRGDIFLPHPEVITRLNYKNAKEDFIKSFIEQEYSVYPVVSHDDALDALAYICDPVVQALIKPPVPQIKLDPVEIAMRNSQRNQRLRVPV